MGKYIGWTRIYLVVLTVLIVMRFGLEAAGVGSSVTSELSVSRLYFVLPVFLGIRFATEKLGGIKEMVFANFTYFRVRDGARELRSRSRNGLRSGYSLHFHGPSGISRGSRCGKRSSCRSFAGLRPS